MRRSLRVLLALSTAVVPSRRALVAQPSRAMAGLGIGNDPTRRVVGSGRLPAGWAMRFDPLVARPGRPAPPTPRPADVDVTVTTSGLRFRSGPAAIYYRAAEQVTAPYTVSATFTQTRSMAHEAYGLLFGGANLPDATERYLYFLVRPMDGKILVSRRSSDALPTALVPWTSVAAVHREDPADGHATNRLAVHVGADSVWFIANGRVVRALARSELGAPIDGVVGVRINHNLDLQVADFRLDRHVGPR
jgi:hypothetical protein